MILSERKYWEFSHKQAWEERVSYSTGHLPYHTASSPFRNVSPKVLRSHAGPAGTQIQPGKGRIPPLACPRVVTRFTMLRCSDLSVFRTGINTRSAGIQVMDESNKNRFSSLGDSSIILLTVKATGGSLKNGPIGRDNKNIRQRNNFECEKLRV